MGQDPQIQMIVGLGNPGDVYQGSRHNIGFAVVERLAQRFADGAWNTQATYREAEATIGGRSVVLACPLTFMNRSGQAVTALMARSGLALPEVMVVVDDIDLALGRMRIRKKGGAGTHNGLRDISDAEGDDYPRLRVGVGVGGGDAGADLAKFVLAPFPDDEKPMVERVIEQAVAAVEAAVCQGVSPAMNHFNGSIVENPQEESQEVRRIWDLGRMTPSQLAPWTAIDDVIVVECPRPGGHGFKYWSEWFRWWMGPQRIRLDTVGSAIWLGMDGTTSLASIVDRLAEEKPDDREHLVARVDLFVRTLASQGLLRLRCSPTHTEPL